jgi:CobQ-like glutamine amidotransferase family enzyme
LNIEFTRKQILGAVFFTTHGTFVHGLSMVSFPHSKNVKRFGIAIHTHTLEKHKFQETDVPVLGHSRNTQRIHSVAECQ